jgi:hypothetical protein
VTRSVEWNTNLSCSGGNGGTVVGKRFEALSVLETESRRVGDEIVEAAKQFPAPEERGLVELVSVSRRRIVLREDLGVARLIDEILKGLEERVVDVGVSDVHRDV